MQPKVSMVVPCYNKKDYIGAFLASVHAQNWKNLQIICVNDGSDDGTREVLTEWEPALREQFSFTILDQPNQGVALAVKNGLELVTGDYVCIVDCDDELYPDYASAMAEYLESNPSYDGCVCDFDYYLDHQMRLLRPREHGDDRTDLSGLTLEDFVLGNYCRGIWRFFVRTPFFERCAIREHIPQSGQRITHEAYITMPLLTGGTFGHLKKSLYKYRVGIPAITNTKDIEKRTYYEDIYLAAVRQVFDWLVVPEETKRRVLSIARLKHDCEIARQGILCAGDSDTRRSYVQAMTEAVNRFFSSYGRTVDTEKTDRLFAAQLLPSSLLWLAVEHAVMPDERLRNNLSALRNKRIIGYGAKGRAAAWRVPLLMGTALEPSVLWDHSATEGDRLCGMLITPPSLETLSENDVLLVLPKNHKVVSSITEELLGRNVTVFIDQEITRMTAVLCFPELQGNG